MEFIYLSHCVYYCDYHIVLVTKYRKAVLNKGIFAYFCKKFAEITEHYPLIQFKTVNHDKDHIHLHMSIPPTMRVGEAVGIIKQNTSRELKQKFPFLKEVYWVRRSKVLGSAWNKYSLCQQAAFVLWTQQTTDCKLDFR